ncbi:MAG: mechanosensitive ion channel [Bryobacterales bacterium]|nr:mechanosensitive ion channel [Bryobacterales bacterium]
MQLPSTWKPVLTPLILILVLIAGWTLGAWDRITGVVAVDSRVAKILNQTLFEVGKTPFSIASLFKTVIFLLLLGLAARMGRRFLHRHVLNRLPIEAGQKFVLESVAGYLIIIFGLIVGLQSAGINLSTLTVLGGALGLGIGFGLQNIANNLISGVILLFEQPIKVSDRVEVGSLNGEVVRIGVRSTWVRTNDNIVVLVPNSEFVSSKVTNWTANDRKVRFSTPVGVSYSSDPAEVRDILLKVASGNPDVLSDPAPDVIFKDFGDNSLDFELRVWTSNKVDAPSVLKSDLNFAIFDAFRAHNIEIPFPQRDVHVRSIDVPLPSLGS